MHPSREPTPTPIRRRHSSKWLLYSPEILEQGCLFLLARAQRPGLCPTWWEPDPGASARLRLTVLVSGFTFIGLLLLERATCAHFFETINSLKGDNCNDYWSVSGVPKMAYIQGICGTPHTIWWGDDARTGSVTLYEPRRREKGVHTITHIFVTLMEHEGDVWMGLV